MSTKRICTRCKETYTHEPLMFDDTDMLSHVTTCEPCQDKSQAETEQRHKESEARKKWVETVPEEYRLTTTDHPDYPKPLHEACMRWMKGESVYGQDKCIFLGLVGESGRCKTRVISQLVKRIIWTGGNVTWLNSARFQWCCQNQFNGDYAQEAGQSLKLYRKASYLVFDDIGSLKSTETVSDNLYELLEHRTASRLPMLWTSNETLAEILTGKALSEKARKRNISRLAGFSNIIES